MLYNVNKETAARRERPRRQSRQGPRNKVDRHFQVLPTSLADLAAWCCPACDSSTIPSDLVLLRATSTPIARPRSRQLPPPPARPPAITSHRESTFTPELGATSQELITNSQCSY